MSETRSGYKNRGVTRMFKAGFYSYKGVVAAYRYEAAFRQEIILGLLLTPVVIWVDVTVLERVALICAMLLVLIVELLNSGIESVVDRVGYEHHELAGRAKDMASAAVFISLILFGVVWGGVLLF
ncbi:MAG: diacylglycerol kinase [Cellvibrionaceae bacterium]|nr:diacylglycerol kinase [Cellvibrionaceae bacterium]